MPTKKPAASSKKSAQTSTSKQTKKSTFYQKVRRVLLVPVNYVITRIQAFLARRPHRSFRRTRRRDYVRSLKMPGYVAFTNHVRKTLWQQKKLFFWMAVVYLVLTIILIGFGSQETYQQLSDMLRSTSGDIFQGAWGELGKAGVLLATGMTVGFNTSIDPVQQVYLVTIILFTWLTTVWLLRAVLAGRKPKLRDGLYNAGSPVLSTFLVGLFLVAQLLPIAVAAVGFTALLPFGILEGGVESMLFWTAALLLTALSFYWITSTLIALVVVTLPGMYPMQAIKTAGDMVVGRRVRILLRFLWLLGMLALTWAVVMVPIILFDSWIKGVLPAIGWVPIVPICMAIMTTLTVIWAASYVYLLYRRIVDDDVAPA